MAISSEKKDDIFRNPDMNSLHFGRHISSANFGGKTYSAMQMGKGKQTTLLVCEFDNAGKKRLIEGPWGGIHQPFLCAGAGGLYVAWNELVGEEWLIRLAEIDTGSGTVKAIETAHRSPKVCHPPTLVFHENAAQIAFSSIQDGSLRVHIASRRNEAWRVETPFPDSGSDCMRPQVASDGTSLLVVWDEYKEKNYGVVLGAVRNGVGEVIKEFRDGSQRWLTPRIVAAANGPAYVCWVAMQPVTDKLGIIDHHCFIRAARYLNGEIALLKDRACAAGEHIVGDLREGMLADEIYKGHVGLRRNPKLALDENQKLWLFWEMRKETRTSEVVGHLVGRKMIDVHTWSETASYSNSGYCYAVPNEVRRNAIVATYYYFAAKDTEVVRSEKIDLSGGDLVRHPSNKWRRWKNVVLTPPAKPEETVRLGDGEYRLVWADTHCHSNFSADAEGEPDELVRFGRDLAGLDAVTIIDNDYYPHKALTEPEWRIHQDMSEHLSKQGEFVWLPGYEFTYHRADLQPDFNHRCVIFPKRGGKLLRRIDPETNTDAKMIAALKKTAGMAYPHHSNYDLIDPSVEWNVEACSSWRVCIEETTCTVEKLKKGAKLGFLGSSDTHRMIPGLGGARTGLFVKELTPEALFDAYRHHRTIATQGFNIFIDFRVSGVFIGQEVETRRSPIVKADIQAPDKIDYVEIIRDGETIWWDNPGTDKTSFEVEDGEIEPGEHFYFLKVKTLGDPSLNVDTNPAGNFPKPFEQNSRYPHNLARAQGVFAWTSPIWVKAR